MRPPGGGDLVVSCLCVTHDRPEFLPWVVHQFEKQQAKAFAELVIVESGAGSPSRDGGRIHHTQFHLAGISAKRQEALTIARAPFITWFDDDDWQAPDKLARCLGAMQEGNSAAGARHAYMYSIHSGQATTYESTYEPIIFNSAVYRKDSVPPNFDVTKITGEDTDWHERWLKTRPSYVTLAEPTHAWLCHGRNIVNKANSRFFDMPNPVPFDDWELGFLEKMRAGTA
jgi:hypothetical protein